MYLRFLGENPLLLGMSSQRSLLSVLRGVHTEPSTYAPSLDDTFPRIVTRKDIGPDTFSRVVT